MIKAKDAIAVARSLIGTPYSELDCINLIKAIIRKAPGGVSNYTTAGSNSLWSSFWSSGRYQHITEQTTGLYGAKAGMLAFKADGDDYHHVGIVTESGTVVHSSSTQGGRGVVETPLTSKEGWTHLAVHRYIETSEGGEEPQEEAMEGYKAVVKLDDPNSTLNVRNSPSKDGAVINRLLHGQKVEVVTEHADGWVFVRYGDSGAMGYVAAKYVERTEEEEEPSTHVVLVFTDSFGNEWIPVGDFSAKLKIVED